jgi:G6PDH family F420-dependent oxidoreductase
VAQVTHRVALMTYVTCPTMRYHPAVVAQKAATLQLLADGRFTLGLCAGENLNEHVIGDGWPGVDTRQAMLREAMEIIRELHTGELVTYRGDHFDVDSARIWDCPEGGVPIAVAAGGTKAVEELGPFADHLIATEPEPEIVEAWNALDGRSPIGDGARAIGQIPISWDPDSVDAAVQRAHDQFRWFGGGWSVNADLPTTAGFAAVSAFVRPEDVASSIPCGPDLQAVVDAVKPFWEAGFTDIALVQVGDELQDRFLAEAAEPLLEQLRAAAPRS